MSKKLPIDISFRIKSDWSRGGGFTGNISLTNNGDYFEDWTMEFDAPFEINKIWNGEIVSHVGDHYIIKSGRWNDRVDAGETATFGFNALVDNHTITEPRNYILNQQQLDISQPERRSSPKGNKDNSLIDTSFRIKSDWSHGGGFTGEISLTNNGDSFEDWTMEFDAPFEINKIWNGEIVSHVGDHYVIKNGGWNDRVDAGETATFGFNALVDNHTITEPKNYILNQQQLDISQPEDNDEDDSPSLAPSRSQKPNLSPPSTLSSQAIKVGFEQHNAGTKYNRSTQDKDWKVDWVDSKVMDNSAFISNKEAKTGKNSLSISYSPNARTGGGAGWELPSEKEYYLSYWVKFEDNFDFNGSKQSGGKLPGLGGAGGYCSGGQTCNGNNGFSSRYMWREDGQAQLYLYHMDKPDKYGDTYWFKDSDGKDVYFEEGQWHNLIQRVKINDGKKSNGEIDVWMDGEQVLSVDGLKFVTNNKGIDALMFSTFHGGSSSDWYPDHKQYSYFDDFVVTTNRGDVGL